MFSGDRFLPLTWSFLTLMEDKNAGSGGLEITALLV